MNGRVVTFPQTTVSVRRSGRTVLEKKRSEYVAFHPVAGETFDSASAKAGAFFREADGTVTVDPTDFIPMEDIIHAGFGGDVGNPLDGDAWGLEDVVDTTRDQASRAAVNALQLKCNAANIVAPGNPTEIVALASVGLDHRAAAVQYAAEIVSITSQLTDAKARVEELTGKSEELRSLREQLSVAVATEAQAQADTSGTMDLLVRSGTRIVALERDLELRDTRCTLLTNEAASLRADVQQLVQQLASARAVATRLNGAVPALMQSIHEAIDAELAEASVRTFQSTGALLAQLNQRVGEVTSVMQDRTRHSAPTSGTADSAPPS